MKYALSTTPTLESSDCLVVGLLGTKDIPSFVSSLIPKHQELIIRLSTHLHEQGDIAWQADVDGHSLLMAHCGEPDKFTLDQLQKCIKDIADNVLKHRFKSVTLCMPEVSGLEVNKQLEQMILSFDAACYQFLDYKSKDKKLHQLERADFYLPKADNAGIEKAAAIIEGVRLTKNLANRPANDCTPTYLAEQAIQLAKENDSINTKVLNSDDMQKLGMNAFLAVARGSHEPPKLVEIHYQGTSAETPPIVLVGKGVTFDSGGLSIKPADAMTEMKYDMAGAASVLGTLKSCAQLKLPINVVGLLACTENMPSGSAVKPGDIVKTMSGQTVEILNTDAEGRLVLADTLTYAERFKPEMVLDIATLTGAMLIALGSVYTGFMTKNDELANQIEQAATESGDKAWRLPLDDAYQKSMNSQIADLANISSDRFAGSITAACFLSRFTKNYPWAHLDIAGSAWVSGKKCDATGRPVPLLVQILSHAAAR